MTGPAQQVRDLARRHPVDLTVALVLGALLGVGGGLVPSHGVTPVLVVAAVGSALWLATVARRVDRS